MKNIPLQKNSESKSKWLNRPNKVSENCRKGAVGLDGRADLEEQ